MTNERRLLPPSRRSFRKADSTTYLALTCHGARRLSKGRCSCAGSWTTRARYISMARWRLFCTSGYDCPWTAISRSMQMAHQSPLRASAMQRKLRPGNHFSSRPAIVAKVRCRPNTCPQISTISLIWHIPYINMLGLRQCRRSAGRRGRRRSRRRPYCRFRTWPPNRAWRTRGCPSARRPCAPCRPRGRCPSPWARCG